MSLLNLFMLEKLRIDAYTDVERSTPADPDGMDVMFNPTVLEEKHSNRYQTPCRQGINSPGKPAAYSYTPPGDLDLTFILDGTGVNYFGPEQLVRIVKGESVKKDIAKFKKLCLEMNGDIHEPNFLVISWGDFKFSCRLTSLDITYKLFDEAGDPIRAELKVKFVKDQDAESILLEVGKSSPDLSHVRVVKSGDTLPLLCKEIYGSGAYYLRVAADNGLNDFRNLTPGQRLLFAPLEPGEGPPGA